jgi:purine-binding chemotaxis protein CheW
MADQQLNSTPLIAAELTEAQREAIFARRAEALAAAPSEDAPRAGFEALVFALDSERYAFPRTQVREVRPLGQLTPLRGTPAFIAGLVNVRGRIVAVLDLRPLFGIQTHNTAADGLVLVAHPQGDVGILATGRPTVQVLPAAELGELPAGGPAGLNRDYVRGVTPDLVIVLDAERLLSDPRLLVQEDSLSRALGD